MRIYWSAFLSLLFLLNLTGCGAEQFGVKPQESKNVTNPIIVQQQVSCSNHTLIKPEVDILYIVDNSSSNVWISSEIKNGIQNTINSISSQFDYRVIGTPLLETAQGNQDYQVLAKNPSGLPSTIASTKVVSSSGQFNFFSNVPEDQGAEVGLRRVQEFITSHQSDGLFRQGAYLFIVLISNGRDTEVEYVQNTQTAQNTSIFNARLSALLQLKTYLQSQQFRLFSLTANTRCESGYWPSPLSYAAMSQSLYDSHPGFPSKASADHYDICSNVSTVFNEVNSSIQQIIVPHTYKYWPITFTETPTGLDTASIKVYKNSPNSSPVQISSSSWTYINNSSLASYNTRILPTPGEASSARHLIEFTSGNEVTYPDCIQISSASNLEYFQYVVLNKAPKLTDPVPVLKINGQTIAQSSTNGWSYEGYKFETNIKVGHNGYSDLPKALRTGYFIKLNGSSNYYRSGDNVEIYYLPETN